MYHIFIINSEVERYFNCFYFLIIENIAAIGSAGRLGERETLDCKEI